MHIENIIVIHKHWGCAGVLAADDARVHAGAPLVTRSTVGS